MFDRQTQHKFIQMRAAGQTYNAIAHQLSVSSQTLLRWNRRFSHEIEELKEKELDDLRQKYFMFKQHRIQLFGDQLLRIKDELSMRDLTKVPTAQLLHLLLKYANALRSEFEPRQAQSEPVDPLQRWREIIEQCAIVTEPEPTHPRDLQSIDKLAEPIDRDTDPRQTSSELQANCFPFL